MIRVVSICFLMHMWLMPTSAFGEDLDSATIDSILKLAALDHERIHQRILTWKGKVFVDDATTIQKPGTSPVAGSGIQSELDDLFKEGSRVVLRQQMSGDFVLDVLADKLRSSTANIGDIRYVCEALNKQVVINLDNVGRWQRLDIHTPEHSLTTSPNERFFSVKSGIPVGEAGVKIIHRNTRKAGDGSIYSDVVDPRILFAVNSKTSWVNELASWLKSSKRITGKRAGDAYLFTQSLEGGRSSISIQLMTVEGHLLATSYVFDSKEHRTEKLWKYKVEDSLGIVYPWRLQHKVFEPCQVCTLDRDFQVVEAFFDEQVADSEFQFARMDVADGDQLYDNIQGEYLTFLDGVPAGSSVYLDRMENRLRNKSPFGRVLLIINVIAVVCVFAWVMTRRRQAG